MKIFLSIAVFLICCKINLAQNVGVNNSGATPDVSAMLDIVALDKGLLIPRVALTDINDALTVPTPATSLMVYNTATAGVSPNDVSPGYYYNSGTTVAPVWVKFATGPNVAWLLLGNAGTTAGTNFLGTTDAVDLVVKTNNTEQLRILSTGEVGIGIATPSGGAKVDITSANEGLLIPRVALTATNSNAPIGPTITTSLMVYNTATAGAGSTAVFPGHYYWDGAAWISMTVGGQSSTSYYTTAGLVVTPATAFTYLPGYPTAAITIPANCTVLLDCDVGVQTTSGATNGYSIVDVVLLVDGFISANALYQRTMTVNNGGITTSMQYASMSNAIILTPGAHTFGIAAAGVGIGANANVGGNSGSVLRGQLTVTIIKQ